MDIKRSLLNRELFKGIELKTTCNTPPSKDMDKK
jgi:hypothetical protein